VALGGEGSPGALPEVVSKNAIPSIYGALAQFPPSLAIPTSMLVLPPAALVPAPAAALVYLVGTARRVLVLTCSVLGVLKVLGVA